MCERDQLLDRQKLLSRILLQRQWLILWMYALERADPIGYLTLAETGIKGSPLPRQPEQLTAITGRWSIGPPHYRNTSAMMAAIKPNVASQLTVPINSSVMRPCSPAISDGA